MADLGSSKVYGDLQVIGTIVGELIGNSSSASKLATVRTINGVSFDGTGNIVIEDSTKRASWVTRDVSFTAYSGSSTILLASITVTLQQNPVKGDFIELAKLDGAEPSIVTSDGKLIIAGGYSDTVVNYDSNDRVLIVFNGTSWEVGVE